MWWQFRTGPELSRWGLIALAALLAFCIAACEGEEEPPSTLGPSPRLGPSPSELPTATAPPLSPVPTPAPAAVFPSPEEAIADFYRRLPSQGEYLGDCYQAWLANDKTPLGENQVCSRYWFTYEIVEPQPPPAGDLSMRFYAIEGEGRQKGGWLVLYPEDGGWEVSRSSMSGTVSFLMEQAPCEAGLLWGACLVDLERAPEAAMWIKRQTSYFEQMSGPEGLDAAKRWCEDLLEAEVP